MSIINLYKRKCNECRKVIDKDYAVSVIRGKIHCCHRCAGKLINNHCIQKLKELKQ